MVIDYTTSVRMLFTLHKYIKLSNREVCFAAELKLPWILSTLKLISMTKAIRTNEPSVLDAIVMKIYGK